MTTFSCLGNNKYLWFIMFSGRKRLTCTSQADILHANHNCEVVMIYHKHGSSDRVTFMEHKDLELPLLVTKRTRSHHNTGRWP